MTNRTLYRRHPIEAGALVRGNVRHILMEYGARYTEQKGLLTSIFYIVKDEAGEEALFEIQEFILNLRNVEAQVKFQEDTKSIQKLNRWRKLTGRPQLPLPNWNYYYWA